MLHYESDAGQRTLTPRQVRYLLTSWIAKLQVGEEYQLSTSDAWLEAVVPLVPEMDPGDAALQHLRFFVDIREPRFTGWQQEMTAQLTELVQVRFLSMLGANRVLGWDRTLDAARALRSHLWAGRGQDLVGIDLVCPVESAFRLSPISVPDWLLVTVPIQIRYFSSMEM